MVLLINALKKDDKHPGIKGILIHEVVEDMSFDNKKNDVIDKILKR